MGILRQLLRTERRVEQTRGRSHNVTDGADFVALSLHPFVWVWFLAAKLHKDAVNRVQ